MTELELILMVQHYSVIPELLVEACLLHMDVKSCLLLIYQNLQATNQ